MIYELKSFPLQYVDVLKKSFDKLECEGIFESIDLNDTHCTLYVEATTLTILILVAMQAGNIEVMQFIQPSLDKVANKINNLISPSKN